MASRLTKSYGLRARLSVVTLGGSCDASVGQGRRLLALRELCLPIPTRTHFLVGS